MSSYLLIYGRPASLFCLSFVLLEEFALKNLCHLLNCSFSNLLKKYNVCLTIGRQPKAEGHLYAGNGWAALP